MQCDAMSTSANALILMAASGALSRSVQCIEWHTYITSPHMPGGVYNFQGRAFCIDVLDWDHETGQGRFGFAHLTAPVVSTTSIVLAPIKSRMETFWNRLTEVHLGPLNGRERESFQFWPVLQYTITRNKSQ